MGRRHCLDDRPSLDLPIPCPPLEREKPRGRVIRGREEEQTDEAQGSFDVDFRVDCYV